MTEPAASDVTGPAIGVGVGHVLLSEWAGRYPSSVPTFLGGQPHRSPCPICGHPTGDCTTHLEDTLS